MGIVGTSSTAGATSRKRNTVSSTRSLLALPVATVAAGAAAEAPPVVLATVTAVPRLSSFPTPANRGAGSITEWWGQPW